MLGFEQNTDGSLVKEVSEATFMQDVVEASKERPVIVDFWAPWCGPCKTLGPQLEEAVKAANGAVTMAKVNVDENQAIAGQMQVQSIPTVFAFSNGQPVDGFQGAVSASEIKAFVDRVVAANGGEVESGLDSAVTSAEQMLDDGEFEAAIETFSAILEEDANNIKSYIGLIKCHIAVGDLDQAEAILNGIPLEISQSPEIEAVHAQLELAKQARDAGPINELALLVEKNPDDNDARFKLAQALHGAGQVEDAVDQLLELFKRDREWNDGAAKAQLFTIFEALEPNNEIVLNGRRKLSSLIFA
ncbi:thioredoxin [Paracoccaceae bacterium]|nr:thioredoxin [Paracoccaceae bacterium]